MQQEQHTKNDLHALVRWFHECPEWDREYTREETETLIEQEGDLLVLEDEDWGLLVLAIPDMAPMPQVFKRDGAGALVELTPATDKARFLSRSQAEGFVRQLGTFNYQWDAMAEDGELDCRDGSEYDRKLVDWLCGDRVERGLREIAPPRLVA